MAKMALILAGLLVLAAVAPAAEPTGEPPDLLLQVRENPENDEAWGNLGDRESGAMDQSVSLGCYTIARLLDWDDPEWLTKSRMRSPLPALELAGIADAAWIGGLGDIAAHRGQADIALELYQQALQLEPDSPEWRQKAAGTGAPLGTPLDQTRFLLAREPGSPRLWERLGDLMRDAGNPETAQGCYTVARLLDPENANAMARMQAEGWELARAAAAVEFAGIADDEWVGELGDAAAGMEIVAPVARELYELALRLDPDDPEWRRKATPGTPPATPEEFRPRLRQDPGDSRLWRDLGGMLTARGDAELGRGCRTIVLLLDPVAPPAAAPAGNVAGAVEFAGITDDEWIGDLGDAAAGQNLADAARSLYQLARRLDPDDPEWRRKAGP